MTLNKKLVSIFLFCLFLTALTTYTINSYLTLKYRNTISDSLTQLQECRTTNIPDINNKIEFSTNCCS